MSRIRTVLCPVDFSVRSRQAVELAAAVCGRLGARLVVEHNFDPRPPQLLAVVWMWSEDHERAEEEKAERASEKLKEILAALPPGVSGEARLTRGPVDQALLLVAREIGADLIVMASHGPSGPHHRSLTEQLIVEAPCPVLTLPEAEAGPGRLFALPPAGAADLPAVVPLDGTAHSRAAAAFAFDLAERLPLRLLLLHVEPPRLAQAQGGREAARLRELVPERLRDRVEVHVESGRTGEAILAFARRVGACWIVMGAHPKGTLARLVGGATAWQVLHRSPCPVWFVPAAAAAAAGEPVRETAGPTEA